MARRAKRAIRFKKAIGLDVAKLAADLGFEERDRYDAVDFATEWLNSLPGDDLYDLSIIVVGCSTELGTRAAKGFVFKTAELASRFEERFAQYIVPTDRWARYVGNGLSY